MTRQTTIDEALQARDAGMEAVAMHAGKAFHESACAYILAYLHEHGQTSGEDLTEACLKAGIIPHDLRAFGPVYQRLSKHGRIEKCGSVQRARGHMTSGGHVWRLIQSREAL